MLRGFIRFYCSECGESFTGPDIEFAATVWTAPLKCPHCGSWHTRPWSILPAALANLKYKLIWKMCDENRSKHNSD